MESKVQITLKVGVIGTTERQKSTVNALGLRYRESSRVVKDTPALRGMVKTVGHLVSLEKITETLVMENPFGGVSEYELGPLPEKREPEKKKKAPSLKTVDGGMDALPEAKKAHGTKKEAKASTLAPSSKGKSKAPRGAAKKTPSTKKAKGS